MDCMTTLFDISMKESKNQEGGTLSCLGYSSSICMTSHFFFIKDKFSNLPCSSSRNFIEVEKKDTIAYSKAGLLYKISTTLH